MKALWIVALFIGCILTFVGVLSFVALQTKFGIRSNGEKVSVEPYPLLMLWFPTMFIGIVLILLGFIRYWQEKKRVYMFSF